MEILKKKNRRKCKYCKKVMTYNNILGKWECCNCECLVTRMSGSMYNTFPVGVVAGVTPLDTLVDLLGLSSKTAKKFAKTAKPVKGSTKAIKVLPNNML